MDKWELFIAMALSAIFGVPMIAMILHGCICDAFVYTLVFALFMIVLDLYLDGRRQRR